LALTYGRIAKIAAQLSNGLVHSAMGQIPCSTERISSTLIFAVFLFNIVLGITIATSARKFVFKNSDEPKWENPLFWGKTDFTVGFADPIFRIQCATFI